MQVHSPDNEAPIDELYAWLSVDDNGNHGICAGVIRGVGAALFVSGDKRLALAMKGEAAEIARAVGKPVALYGFTRMKDPLLVMT